jgi:hypothetical protein
MCIRAFFVLAFVLGCSISHAEDAVEIPLSEIWALDMPGTRDVRELEPEAFGQQVRSLQPEDQIALQKKSLIGQIRAQLYWDDRKKPMPGFAVSGNGIDALRAVRDVLIENSGAHNELRSTDLITVLFSSLQSGVEVHIYEAKWSKNLIQVYYRFAPHEQMYSTEHFALIPLGKLTRGEYHVKYIVGPMEAKFRDAGFKPATEERVDRLISQSFKFNVK